MVTFAMQITSHARTVDALLHQTTGESLVVFIETRRAEKLSYAKIAQALYEATDKVVNVTGETIRNWDEAFEKEAS